LSRSLLDFSRIIGLFDKHGVSFVSVTQQFNTTSSMGRLTLNILLSFAQFEREIDQEWTEYTLTRTFSDPSGTEIRYKAEMTGNNLVFPRIHTLGATLS